MIKQKKINVPPGPEKKSSTSQLIVFAVIFLTGFLTGVAFTVYKMKAIPQTVTGAASEAKGPAAHAEENSEAIKKLEAEVTKNPSNYQAWTNLANLYYDTEQAEKAINAYNKVLALNKGDADILTDLGVMYRKNNQSQKAVEAFEQASKLDPHHLPSRYNKGIVLLYDLNKPQEAITSWQEMLKIDPQAGSKMGVDIQELIDKVKADLSKKQ